MDIWFFIISMALCAGVFIFLGYLGYRKTKTAEDYFVAGRKMGAVLIASLRFAHVALAGLCLVLGGAVAGLALSGAGGLPPALLALRPLAWLADRSRRGPARR